MAAMCLQVFTYVLLLLFGDSYSVTIRPAGASAGALGSHCTVLFIPQNKNFFLHFSFIGSHCLIASNVFGYTSMMFCIEISTSKQMA